MRARGRGASRIGADRLGGQAAVVNADRGCLAVFAARLLWRADLVFALLVDGAVLVVAAALGKSTGAGALDRFTATRAAAIAVAFAKERSAPSVVALGISAAVLVAPAGPIGNAAKIRATKMKGRTGLRAFA